MVETTLAERIFATLALIERRGWCVEVEHLARLMIGGVVGVEELRTAIQQTPGLHLSDGRVYTDSLDSQTRRHSLKRQQCNRAHTDRYWAAVEEYVERLVRRCAQVRCVALAGSMASGGFIESDDIDFNLFVEDGTRYQTYLQANLLALDFSARYGHRPTDSHTQRWIFPKLMSVNVIWTDSDTRPFVRQDGAMALELFLSQPLRGREYFRGVLGCNSWLDDYFPQVRSQGLVCSDKQPVHQSRWSSLGEQFCRHTTYLGWQWVMWTRRHNPEALARVEQVRKHQSPYALFEDRG